MTTKKTTSYFFLYIILCTIAYCAPVMYLLNKSLYTNLWLLYLGNGLFFVLMLISAILSNRNADNTASLTTLVVNGIKICIASIVIICIVLLILILAHPQEATKDAPLINVRNDTNGLRFALFINAILVNFLVGSFGAFVGAVTAKQNQKTEKGKQVGKMS